MGEAAPPKDISPWLLPKSDLYVITTQECVYKTANGSSCEQDWFKVVSDTLGSDYARVHGLSLLNIRMAVFVHRKHAHKIHHVEAASLPTGIGNVIGNKGGVAVSFFFNESSFCFIGCHLAAREERLEERNNNYKAIFKGLQLEGLRETPFDLTSFYDHVFWAGDLNYRINMTRESAVNLALANEVDQLLETDQLLDEMKNERVFCGFHEPPIHFVPTYRYDRGASTYSHEVSAKLLKSFFLGYKRLFFFPRKIGLLLTATGYSGCPFPTTTCNL